MNKKRIPTLLGLILTFLGLGAVIFLVQFKTAFFSQANISKKPNNIIVANVKENQFSVAWTTDTEVEGFISYGESKSMGNMGFDRRDQSFTSKGKYKTHFITVSGLAGGKNYYFKIGSGRDLYGGDLVISKHCQDYLIPQLDGKPYQIILPAITSQKMARMTPISGQIATDEQTKTPVNGALVCLQTAGLVPLLDITSNIGNYLIPLVSVLKQDLTVLENFPDNLVEEIMITDENLNQTMIKVKSDNDHPVPIIYLGENEDFTNETTESLPTTPTTTPAVNNFEISFPIGEISDTMPTFRGKGLPGQNLDIKVESLQTYEAKVKVDESGSWVWTPPGNLEPGEHTVTISVKDENGNIKELIKKFTVLATNPIMPAFAGTPSATLVPTMTTTPSLTPTQIPTPTATPTPFILPNTANESPYLIFLTIGLISITLGIGLSYKLKL